MEVEKIWKSALEVIKPDVLPTAFTTWFMDIKPISMDDSKIVLSMTNDLMIQMIKPYHANIISAIHYLTGKLVDVEFTARNQPFQKMTNAPAMNNLNPKYTFDSFVVGNSNHYAHAVSVGVSEGPGSVYNPLLIYGGSGLGKTHLMQAIGNYAGEFAKKMYGKELSIVYISSEKFTTELISAISKRTTAQFREKYRNVDILLLDDIQFLEGKDMAQEEFFHTFNELYDANKQIVLTSDRPPREIDIEERLKTRFSGGIQADIKPPDYETRIAILQKKASVENIEIPYEVYCFIADCSKSNIRELEGALMRLLSYAKVTGREIDLELTKEALESLVPVVRITATSINEAVSKFYDIPVADIKGKRKMQNIADARQIAMYLCRILTDMSYETIGKEYDRHYSTAMHAVDNITKKLDTDEELNYAINTLTKQLKSILH